jgi:FtsP/CotA-like multicopper oxidase with cupredoxin domain
MLRNTVRRPRATIIALSSAVAAGLALTLTLAGCDQSVPAVSTIGTVDFDSPLVIPPLAESTVDPSGTRHFDLTASEGELELLDGPATSTWGFNGSYLGPTLVARAGEDVAVDVTNNLGEPTTVHWHGMHLPPEMDGGPHQMVAAGDTWTPEWTVDQNAATLWYHPHLHGKTLEHVSRGLAGMFIIQDDAEAALPLPRDYGVDDIPVIVQDVRFDNDNQFRTDLEAFVGPLGDQVLVNGTLGPYLEVSTDVVRLRVLNASVSRIYNFTFSDDRTFALVASDGGLLEAPVELSEILLSPGERAEILVSMKPGETVQLQSRDPELGGIPILSNGNSGGDDFDVLELRAASTLESVGTVPASLVPIERLNETDVDAERTFVLDGTQINQHGMSMDRVDEVVTLGNTEIWNVRNNMAFPHSFHIHDVQFQVLDVAGSPPPLERAGWKDTVYLLPNTDYRLIMQFTDYADPDSPYMYHCHLLKHEDQGMMGQFVVVKPGQSVGTIEGENHEH